MSAAEIDPITVEVFESALAATADEMALVIMRSAYSAVVRDSIPACNQRRSVAMESHEDHRQN